MIKVEGLAKHFTANKEVVAAVAGIDFEVAAGEMVTLLGPSGCGKTTTLRCVAGLEKADGGRIVIGNQCMVDVAAGVFVPPHKRNLGMVFQSYAIWPHMTVLENVAYALEGRGIAKAERRKQAMAALDKVQLAHLADRPAPRLSGGQQQRVAIARALVGRPQVLLFDEPLSNLDARLRMEMRSELRRIQKQIGLSSIYVTHDQAEALAVSDWIVVMKDGRIVERGRPLDIYRYPRHMFTAQFLGTTNLIPGTVATTNLVGGRLQVTTALGPIIGIDPAHALASGAKVRVSIRPEDLSMQHQLGSTDPVNTFDGTLTFAVFAGTAVEAEVRCGQTNLQCLLNREADLTPGRAIALHAKADACLVLPEE
ncbi:MAG: iron(III) transport system ATP-binding protein [Alphaproteobacteria bacterium]|nr:iron(III) transport system ATP-binding protein [Alphaproteobacteria bacterium]